jgi:hypothetical protein
MRSSGKNILSENGLLSGFLIGCYVFENYYIFPFSLNINRDII